MVWKTSIWDAATTLRCTTLWGAMVFTTLTRQCLPDSIFSRRTMTSLPRYQSATCCCVTSPSNTAIPIVGGTRRRLFSVRRRSGSSVCRVTGYSMLPREPSRMCNGCQIGAGHVSMPCSPSDPIGVSPGSGPGACPSHYSFTRFRANPTLTPKR